MTGYFTGREIDTFEWTMLQYGAPAEHPGEEERSAWPVEYPELCVESYCATPDLLGRHGFIASTPKDEAEFAAKYRKEIQRMRADGVPFCSRQQVP